MIGKRSPTTFSNSDDEKDNIPHSFMHQNGSTRMIHISKPYNIINSKTNTLQADSTEASFLHGIHIPKEHLQNLKLGLDHSLVMPV
jgi:hypothetical protein